MSVTYRQIPNLGPVITLSGAEDFEVVQAGMSKRATVDQVSSLVVNRVLALPLQPTGAAGGDLVGSYPNPKIRPGLEGQFLVTAGGIATWQTSALGGTVTSVSVVSANGLAGAVATATTTPAITLRTTVTGLLKGDGTAISAAVPGTDYLTPGGAGALYQPLDADLTALAALSTTGMMARTAANTYALRTITGTTNRLTVSNGDGVAGNPTLNISATYDALWQPVDAGLTVLSSIGTGIIANTAADTFAARTITGTASRITVTNGNGVSGNPTLDINSAYDALWAPVVHSHTSAAITDFSEAVDDRVAALLIAGSNVTLTYNDVANTLTIASTASGGGGGTVTSVSVVSANGLAGTVATPTTTPAITLSTTITGMLKGDGTAISAGVAGTDYVTPGGLTTALGSYLPLTGGALAGPGNLTVAGTLGVTGALTGTTATMSSNIITNGGYVMVDRTGDAASANVYLRADAAQTTALQYQTGTSTRWQIYKNSTAEGGSNAGSDLQVVSCDDAGAALATPLLIKRSTGYVLLGTSSTPAARLHVYGVDQTTANFDPAGSQGATVYVHGSGTAAGTGGAVMFGDGFGPFAAIKSIATSGTGPLGYLSLTMRKLGADTTFTETSRFHYDSTFYQYGTVRAHASTAVPAGGTLGAGVMFSSTANFGIHFGSGLPDKAAAQGSWYMRSDATASTGFYVNTDGTAGGWSALSGGGGGASISVGPTPPGSPTDGALWYYSDNVLNGGQLMIRYNDGAGGAQWVPCSPSMQSLSAALSNYLPLAGGTLSGGLSGTSATFSGNITGGNVYSNNEVSATGQIYTAANVFASTTIYAAGIITGGGGFDCGLRIKYAAYNGSNTFAMNWDTQTPYIIVDGSSFRVPYAVSQINYYQLYTPAGGSPTNWAMGLFDGYSNFAIHVDAISDQRVKKDIYDSEVDALAVINALKVRRYSVRGDYLTATNPDRTEIDGRVIPGKKFDDWPIRIGLVTQEVSPHIPEMVTVAPPPSKEVPGIPSDLQHLSLAQAVPYLIKAIQQLTARVAELEAKI